MTNPQAYINDFVTILTKFDNSAEGFETSEYTGVQDFFETHLSDSVNNEDDLEQYGIMTYKLKVGDTVKLKPSKWAIGFAKEHKVIDDNKEYEYNYVVKDIELKMYSRNPKAEGDIPKLSIQILLSRK